MDAQHGGRALDSYLEDPGSILLPSFQRVFSPPLVLFSVGPPPAAACSLTLGLVQENGVAQNSLEER